MSVWLESSCWHDPLERFEIHNLPVPWRIKIFHSVSILRRTHKLIPCCSKVGYRMLTAVWLLKVGLRLLLAGTICCHTNPVTNWYRFTRNIQRCQNRLIRVLSGTSDLDKLWEKLRQPMSFDFGTSKPFVNHFFALNWLIKEQRKVELITNYIHRLKRNSNDRIFRSFRLDHGNE